MRYYIEEQADWDWENIKKYILSIKNKTVDELIDESLKNIKRLDPNSLCLKQDWWVKDYKDYHKNDSIETLITNAVEERFYIFRDEEEHEWNKHVVHSVLKGKGWVHRWDNYELK